MADFKTAKVWLSEGEKVRPKNWSSWHFIFWDANSLCCRDEDKDIIDISKFDDSDFEIYTEESKCEKMTDIITEVVEEHHKMNDIIFKEDLINKLKKAIADEIVPTIIGIRNCLSDDATTWAVNDLKNVLKDLEELKEKLVGE